MKTKILASAALVAIGLSAIDVSARAQSSIEYGDAFIDELITKQHRELTRLDADYRARLLIMRLDHEAEEKEMREHMTAKWEEWCSFAGDLKESESTPKMRLFWDRYCGFSPSASGLSQFNSYDVKFDKILEDLRSEIE